MDQGRWGWSLRCCSGSISNGSPCSNGAQKRTLREVLDRQADIPAALEEYDATAGDALRSYAAFSYRRSLEKIDFEVFSIEFAHLLGITRRHPTLWGIYDEDFELVPYLHNYQRDIVKARFLVIGLVGGLVAGLVTLALSLGRRRTAT